MRCEAIRILTCLGALGVACTLAAAQDGVQLHLQQGAQPGEVVLDWSGKQPSYEIYRSEDVVALIGPANRIGQTSGTQWIDTPPPEGLSFYEIVSRPPVLDDLLLSSGDVASSMETLRILDESIVHNSQMINSAQYLYLASKSILAMTSEDPFPPVQPPPTLAPPNHPYPGIDLDDTFYGEPFTKDGYVALFRQVDDEYTATGAYPASLTVPGTSAEVRYPEIVYYAAGILRTRRILGYLPEHWDRYIIATEGLVPWSTPSGFEDYTAALEDYNGIPFFPNQARRYYGSSAHEYEMLKLGRSIYGNTNNAYRAGEELYNWAIDQWINVVGYTSGRTQFSSDRSGWEWENFFFHTSGGPRRIISHLFRAVGLPSAIAGAAYFPNRGWVNIDSHRPYGTDPLDNPFYYDDVPPPTNNHPYPTPNDDFIVEINAVSAEPPTPASPGEQRSIYLNPSDVLDYGAGYVVDRAGGFDTLVMTVKSLKGYLYYGSTGWPEREQADALGPLIQEAHARGKKVYAAVATIADRITAAEQPDWLQKLNEDTSGNYPNLNISPCVQAYQDRLVSLLQNLVQSYDVDGVVLDYLFYANIFGTDDTVGHVDCPTGTDWMPGAISDYASTLVETIENVDPAVKTVITSFPLGIENRYFGLTPVEIGHQDVQALSQIADDVMLSFLGTYWVPRDPPYWETAISDYRALTGRDPWVTFHLVDEWEYPPRFYRGLAHRARQSGIAGFNLHTNLSTLGELSPALTRSQWDKVGAMRLLD